MAAPIIVGGVRTPFVKAGGPFNYLPAQELGRVVVRELLERFNLDPAPIDEVITGNVAPTDAANVSRVISLRAGIPKDRVAHTVNRNCASGLEAVTEAYERIRGGRAQAVIAVGVDSMSNIPLLWKKSLTDDFFEMSDGQEPSGRSCGRLARIRPRDLAPGDRDQARADRSGLRADDGRYGRKAGPANTASAARPRTSLPCAAISGRRPPGTKVGCKDEVMTFYPEKAQSAVDPRHRAAGQSDARSPRQAQAVFRPPLGNGHGRQLVPGDRWGRRPAS